MAKQVRWTSARTRAATTVSRRQSLHVAGVALVGLVLASPALLRAQTPAFISAPLPLSAGQKELFKATSSRAAQDDAVRSIPFDKFDPAAQAKVSAVLADVSLFRRMPVDVMQCDPELYQFLLQHPDVVVNIWEVLGISRIRMKQTEPNTFQITDDDGTVGTLQVLYRDQNKHVILSEGSYNGPLFGRQLLGKVLIVLTTGYIWRPDGSCYVTTRLDSFTKIDNIGLEIITKTIQPLVGKTADLNFIQTANFVASLSQTAKTNRIGLQRLAQRLNHVQPEVRQEFAGVVERISQKAVKLNDEEGPSATVAEQSAEIVTR